jgi:D-alanyl-D-alanine carboxypeptidase
VIHGTSAVVRRELDQLIARSRIPGIQYVVTDANDVWFEHTAGFANLQAHTPVSHQTTFMASSSTKVVTAAAVLQLVERQKLALDNPLSTYYTSHPYTEKVTIRQLLAQTSGIPNPLPLKWLHRADEHDAFNEDRALQETLRHHPRLSSTPGHKYGYSNISYWLLGKAIEAASGRRFSDYVKENVFAPLGVSPSAASFQIENPAIHATGYQKRFSVQGLLLYLLMERRMLGKTVKGYRAIRPVYMNGPAYGGLICTATGFAAVLQDILKPAPQLFTAKTRDLLLTPQSTTAGQETGMSLGLRIGRLQNEPYFGKPGGGPGFRSNVRIYPHSGLGTAWLANETGVSEAQMDGLSNALDCHWQGKS